MKRKITKGVYQIVNIINNKRYVGSSRDLESRYNTHMSYLDGGNHHNTYLQVEYDKYGKENFKFEVIEYVEHKQDLIAREQYWIDELDVCNEEIGYNICPTAGSNKHKWTYKKDGDAVKKIKTKNVDWMAEYLSSKYRSMDIKSTKDIIQNFMKVCMHETLQGNKVRISKIGAFSVKTKSEKPSKDFRGKPRIVPKMVVPTFKTSSTFRDYINSKD